MTGRPDATRPDLTVLIVDEDPFQADYVSAVVASRGICVVRSAARPSAAIDAIHTYRPHAAVVGQDNVDAQPKDVVAALAQLGIPCLTLLRAAPPTRVIDKPVLARPFAAFQVAEWILEVVGPVTARSLPPLRETCPA